MYRSLASCDGGHWIYSGCRYTIPHRPGFNQPGPIHDCRREAFETEARRGFSQMRPTQAYWQSVEEAEREQPRRARGSDDGAGIHE